MRACGAAGGGNGGTGEEGGGEERRNVGRRAGRGERRSGERKEGENRGGKVHVGGGSKERRGLFRARCAALRRQIAGSGLPFTSGFVCFVLGFWLFFCCRVLVVDVFVVLCVLCLVSFFPFFFPFLPPTPLFIYYIYFLARVRLFLFRIARVLTPHLRV